MPTNTLARLTNRWSAAVMLLVFAAGALTATPVAFRAPAIYPASAMQVVAADFSGDGHADLALLDSYYSNVVQILLNSGHGTFKSAVTYAAGTGVAGLAVGDFNRDGKPDVAVTNNQYDCVTGCPNAVSILLGNGDGTFQPPLTFAAGAGPTAIATGDFNGDGKLDLVFSNYGYVGYGQTVGVLLGNGDGTFQPEVDYLVSLGPGSIAIADFNGDGKLDLAVACYNGVVSLLLGNGDGTFRPQGEVALQLGINGIVAGDLNGDGRQDLVVCGADGIIGSDQVFVLLGNGDATFQTPVGYRAESNAFALALADFNGDGTRTSP